MSSANPSSHNQARAGRGVTAVLGPTNTGKTHLAIERMVSHESGTIGLPLRLLAREVYQRVLEKVGSENVALITGEEKIKPETARYFVCTVEAMPMDIKTDFLAVDEIQLAGDLDRGHVFTDRLLNRRGTSETLLLGAGTMRPLIERLLPGANIISRPRLSMLSYAGDRKITRLPRRSAIVSFSSSEVYTIAELIRRQRGGAAVVLGAMSPRTRNAQVALYQAGDVDFLVATDAIGMGLNLDVEHVAFAADRKFDGFQYRRLTPAEFGQVAGRAGRFKTDGTFGVTARVTPFDNELVERIEGHEFAPLEVLQWRNPDLDFSSPEGLLNSLDQTPRIPGLTRAHFREDRTALETALRSPDVKPLMGGADALERLWDVCAVPDYRKIAPANHAELVIDLFVRLSNEGVIPDDWINQQIGYADRVDGDIDTLSNRIAHIRTWTFVANRPAWLADPVYWRETTRAVEDRLSDALHEKLIQRFVDRRTSVLMKRMQETETLNAYVDDKGQLHVEDHHVGRIDGLTFHAEIAQEASHGKAIRAAAQRVLNSTLRERAKMLSEAPDSSLSLTQEGLITWNKAVVAKLEKSDDLLLPRVVIVADDELGGAAREATEERLETFFKAHVQNLIKPLFDLRESEMLEGVARGIAFRLVEGLGTIPRQDIADDVKSMEQPVRATLRSLGVRFGAYHVFVPPLLKPGPRSLLAQFYALWTDTPQETLTNILHLCASGRTSVPLDQSLNEALYRSVGYRVSGQMAVRVDILERLADQIRPLISWRETPETIDKRPDGAVDGHAFMSTVEMTSLVGCAGEDFASILKSLGYRAETKTVPVNASTEIEPATEEQTLADPSKVAEASEADTPDQGGQEPVQEVSGPRQAGDETQITPDETTIVIWRPKPPQRRPHRSRSPSKGSSADNAGPRTNKKEQARSQKKNSAKKIRSGNGQAQTSGRAPRPEKKVDPDSPFAALAALKQQLSDPEK